MYGLKPPEFEGQGPPSVRNPMSVLKKEPIAPPLPPVIPPLTPTFTPGIDKPAVSHVISEDGRSMGLLVKSCDLCVAGIMSVGILMLGKGSSTQQTTVSVR